MQRVAGRVRDPIPNSRLKGTAAVGLEVDPGDGGGSLGLCPDPAAVVGKGESSPSCSLCDDTVVSSPFPEPRRHPTCQQHAGEDPTGIRSLAKELWLALVSCLPDPLWHSLPTTYLRGFYTRKFISQPKILLVLPSQY